MSDYAELKRLAERTDNRSWPDKDGGYFDVGSRDSGVDDSYGHEFDYLSACSPSVILDLISENEELLKDAERYRWLRDKDQFDPRFQHEALAIAFRDLTGGALDGVIDSIMRVDGAASDES